MLKMNFFFKEILYASADKEVIHIYVCTYIHLQTQINDL